MKDTITLKNLSKEEQKFLLHEYEICVKAIKETKEWFKSRNKDQGKKK